MREYVLLSVGIITAAVGGVFLVDIVHKSSMVVFTIGTVLIWSIASPICQTLTISSFSKMLGSKPQASWMGWLTAAGSLGRTIFPMVAAAVPEVRLASLSWHCALLNWAVMADRHVCNQRDALPALRGPPPRLRDVHRLLPPSAGSLTIAFASSHFVCTAFTRKMVWHCGRPWPPARSYDSRRPSLDAALVHRQTCRASWLRTTNSQGRSRAWNTPQQRTAGRRYPSPGPSLVDGRIVGLDQRRDFLEQVTSASRANCKMRHPQSRAALSPLRTALLID